MANNYDLAAAVARVEQHGKLARKPDRNTFLCLIIRPMLSYGYSQFIYYSPSSNMNGAQGFLLTIGRASWEADRWGRIRRTNEGAWAQ